MTKKELAEKKELARLYYLCGESQQSIAEKTGVSATTISKWADGEGWKVARAARNITRQELITKMLKNASDKMDSGTISADEMVKIATAIEKIDKKTNAVTMYEAFSAYNRWLETRMKLDPKLTPELIKAIAKYQDLYLAELTNGNINMP